MCLGIPGEIIEKFNFSGTKMAKVNFGGVIQDVCVETTPNAEPGDFVIVHAGFALSILSREEAEETLSLLAQIAELSDQDQI